MPRRRYRATSVQLPSLHNTSTNHPINSARKEVRSWQIFLLNENRVKLSSYIQAICALRFFHQNTLHRRTLSRGDHVVPFNLSLNALRANLIVRKSPAIE